MWRSLRLLPSISSSQSPSLPVSHLRNILSPPSKSNLGAAVPALSRSFSVSKTPAPLRSFSRSSPLSLRTFKFCTNCALVVARCVSSASPANAVKWNEPVSFSEAGEDDAKPAVPVRAYFFSTSVDLKSLVEQYKPNYITPTSRTTNYIVLKFGNHSASDGMGAWLSGSDCCYMVVFHYGSIVLFNVRDHDVDSYLKIVEKHASGLLPEMKKDEYEVRENPTLNKWMEGGLDYIMLRYLNVDAIRTIGGVLGQSIALDYYVHQVDGMVSEFADINRGMEKTGTFTMHKKKLFQIVGKANSNLADVILKLGLFEKSDIGWKDAKYAQIWEYLRDEFELSQRFGTLEIKFKFVERNIRFLHEILQNRKSALLEGVVILLISVNILIYIYNILHRSAITSL